MTATIRTLEELAAEAKRFALAVKPKERSATLVTLSGELGAGKTAFAGAVAKALGVGEAVTSPTFVLEKIYALPVCDIERGFDRLVHIDAYRLAGAAELAPLGFDELMRDAGNLILLEWPEQVGLDADPRVAERVRLELQADGSRTI
ncbi:MAG: tRNA (adenosine(37)-N6)-threonylcarbamoyltransferase complex ATPase subunit type 1 TsaE, partial [Patescibacteria group bacterium]|nr:tRNA (adenosine(37)-N6)-threonylcarbamoyltransferase complex ATPase subunit type 1 TsaE [Patescibacteria group bacterium]